MRSKGTWLLYSVLCLLLAFSVAVPVVALADDPVPLPHNFYGSLTIDTEPALAGTEVEARGEGVMIGTEGNPITTTVEGQYGGPGPLDPKLEVQGYIDEGAPIEFYVDEVKAQCRVPGTEVWLDSYPWHSNGRTELDLRVGEVPADTTAPEVTITELTPDPTSDNTPTFTGTATDTESNITSVGYKIDTVGWLPATAVDGAFDSLSEEYTFTASELLDGAYTVYVRATDSAFNTTAIANYAEDSFTVDTTALMVTIDAVTTPTNVATQTLTGTMSEGLTVVLTADTAATFGAVSYPTTTTWSCNVSGLVEGSNGITATADTSTASATIVLDTTAPTVVSESPADGATGVPVDTVVTATFGEDVTTVDLSGITISGATNVSATLNEATDTITIAHDNFALLTSCTVTIPAGAVQDVAGNPLASAYSWSFITAMASLADLIAGTPSGGTLTLGAGTYTGDVTISQSITITGTVGTIISGSIHILPLTDSGVTIENVTITDYTDYGIWIELVRAVDVFTIRNNTILGVVGSIVGIKVDEVVTSGSLTIRENAISGNEVGIKLLAAVADGSIWFNDITDNTIYGLQQLAVGSNADACVNWWGDISGPQHETTWDYTTNPGGTGDAVSDNIDYTPWLTRDFQTVIDDNIAYFGSPMVWLDTGWNIISTPIALDPACDTWAEYVTLGDDLSIHPTSPAYAFDPTRTDDPWMPLTGDNADYRLEPCDAIYVRMAEPDVAAILYSPNVSVPSKQLYAGWNLVSLAWLPTSMEDIYGLVADEALVSVAQVTGGYTGYVQVVSPSVGYQYPWVYTGDPSQISTTPNWETWENVEGWMIPTEGYWVFMLNEGTLAGFTFTPVSLN